jgi:hypothetical protein
MIAGKRFDKMLPWTEFRGDSIYGICCAFLRPDCTGDVAQPYEAKVCTPRQVDRSECLTPQARRPDETVPQFKVCSKRRDK